MLKKLKSLFIVEEEGSGDTVPEVSQSPKAKSAPVKKEKGAPKVIPPSEIKTSSSTKPDPKFLNSLLSAVESNNLDGFDYLEYKQSLQSLAKMDMDEKTRYESAFAMAKTMGADATKLIQSGQHYVNILQKEQSKFMNAYQGQLSKAKGTENINNLEKVIAHKQKQIEQLKKDIEENKVALEKQKGEVNRSVAKVELTKEKFLGAYAIVAGQIQEDIKRMQQYLK